MALDYLTIPGTVLPSSMIFPFDLLSQTATSTDVERIFSQGRLVLSHVCNRLSVQSTRALMCLGEWSLLGLVKSKDIYVVTVEAEVEGDEVLVEGWDKICFK